MVSEVRSTTKTSTSAGRNGQPNTKSSQPQHQIAFENSRGAVGLQPTPAPASIPNVNSSGELYRLPNVERAAGVPAASRPTSALVGLASSFRVQVDDKVSRARPKTPQQFRQHATHVQALAFAKEPEILADSVVQLKRERNALVSDKHMLLVNKRRLEAVLRKLLTPSGRGDDENMGGFMGGSGGAMNANKVLDDSRALETKLSGGGAVAVMAVSEAEASMNDLRERLNQMVADRDRMVGRLESELAYRRTQAAAVAAGLQRQLDEAQQQASEAQQQASEAQQQVTEAQEGLLAAREQLRGTQEELGATREELGAAQERLRETQEQLQTAQEGLRVAEEETARLRLMLQQADARVAVLEGQVRKLSSKVVALAKALVEAKKLLSSETGTMSKAIEELKTQLAVERTNAEQTQQQDATKIAELEQLVEQLQKLILELQAEKAAALEALVASDTRLNSERECMSSTIEELKKKLAAAERTASEQAQQWEAAKVAMVAAAAATAEMAAGITVEKAARAIAEETAGGASAVAPAAAAEMAKEAVAFPTAEANVKRAWRAVEMGACSSSASDEEAALDTADTAVAAEIDTQSSALAASDGVREATEPEAAACTAEPAWSVAEAATKVATESAAKAAEQMLAAFLGDLRAAAAAAADTDRQQAEREAAAAAEREARARAEAEAAAAAAAAEAEARAKAEADTEAAAAAAAEAKLKAEAEADADAAAAEAAEAEARAAAAAEARAKAEAEAALLADARQAAVEEAEAAAIAVAVDTVLPDVIAQFLFDLEISRREAAEALRAAELAEAKKRAAEAEAKAAQAEAKAAEAEGKAADAAAKAEAQMRDLVSSAAEADAKAAELLRAKEVLLVEVKQQVIDLELQLTLAREEGSAASSRCSEWEAKVLELERALHIKTERVQELEQQVMGLERDLKDLKVLVVKKKGCCGCGC